MAKNDPIRRFSRHTTTRRSHTTSNQKRATPLRLETLEDRLAPATHVWTGLGGNNNWTANANWLVQGTNQALAPNTTDDVLVFPADGLRKETNVNNFAAGTRFASVSVEGSYVLSGNRLVIGTGGFTSKSGNNLVRLTLELPTSASGTPFDVQAGILQVGDTSGTLSGAGGLVKQGVGTMVLARSNSYNGDTTVENGVLRIRNSGALGTSAGKTVVKPAGTVELDGNNLLISEPLVLQSTRPIGGGNSNGTLRSLAGSNAWAGVVTLDTVFGAAVIDVTAGQLQLGPQVVGGTFGGALTKNGAGTLVTTGNASNTYTGPTRVNDGTLVLNKLNGASAINGTLAIGDGAGANSSATVRLLASNQIANTSAVTLDRDGRLDLDGFNDTIGALAMTGGLVTTGAGVLELAGNVTATSAASDAPATIEGQLNLGGTTTRQFTVTDGPAAIDLAIPAELRLVSAGLTKDGAGRMELGGANNHAGSTTVAGGFLRVTNAAALGGTIVGTTVNAGATLEVAGTFNLAEKLTLDGAGVGNVGALVIPSGAPVFNGTVLLANNATVRTDAGGRINGVVSGSGNLTKVGAGTLQLAAANDYTGLTSINEGTLTVSNAQALGLVTAGTTVAAGATLLAGFIGGSPTSAEPLTLSGTGVAGVAGQVSGALLSGGGATFTGTVTLASNARVGALVDSSGDGNDASLTLAGGIGGAFDLETVGAVTFSGATANTHASTHVLGGLSLNKSPGTTAIGGSLIVQGGAVTVQSADQIANDAPVTIDGGTLIANANETIGALTLNAGVVNAAGGAFTLGGDVAASGNSRIEGNVSLGSVTRTFTVAAGGDLRLGSLVSGSITGAAGLIKAGPGRLQVLSDATYSGPTTVNAGTLFVARDIASPVTVNAGATLTGNTTSPFLTGSFATVTSAGGVVNPGNDPVSTSPAGILTVTGPMTLNAASTLHVDIGGTTPGANGHDQVKVTGTGSINLGNATLDLAFVNGFQPSHTSVTTFVLVQNDTNNPIVGQLTAPPQVVIGGQTFNLTIANSGGDVVLLVQKDNTPPMVENLELTPGEVAVGDSVVLTGNLTDPDLADTLTLLVNWGDGSAPEAFSDVGTVPFRFAHQYDAAGSYTVHARWVDQTGEGNGRDLQVQVVAPAPGIDGVEINDGAAQRSMVRSLTVTIAGEVTIDDGAFEVRRQDGTLVAVEVLSAVVDGQTIAVLTFTGSDLVGGSLADGNYTLTIRGDRVTDAAGQALDADGDGEAGGERVDAFFRLFGDGDGDRDVDVADLRQFVGSLGRRQGDAGFLASFDHDADGDVDRADLLAILRRYGSRLPA